jgi:hypothetical protein
MPRSQRPEDGKDKHRARHCRTQKKVVRTSGLLSRKETRSIQLTQMRKLLASRHK